MTDSERIAQQQAASSPDARAPGEEKPAANSAPGPAGAHGSEKSEKQQRDGLAHAKDGRAIEDDGDAAEVQGDLNEPVKTAAERDEYLALPPRTQADFENYRQRVPREPVPGQT